MPDAPFPSFPSLNLPSWFPFYGENDRLVGAIKRVLAIPCKPTPTMYFEAATAGIYEAFVSFFDPDPKEIYHQVMGNSFYHDLKATGERMDIVEPRHSSPATRGFFELVDAVDIAAWWIFIASIVQDGLIDASSQLLAMKPCGFHGDPRFGTGGYYINGFSDDGSYSGCDFYYQWGDGSTTPRPCQTDVVFGQFAVATMTIGMTDFGGTQVASGAQILNYTTGTVLDEAHRNSAGGLPNFYPPVFYKVKSQDDARQEYIGQAGYDGGVPLPLGEAFPDPAHWKSHLYWPGRVK